MKLEILNAVSRYSYLRVVDVQQLLGLSYSTASRHINALVRENLLLTPVIRPDKTKVYGLSQAGVNALRNKHPDSKAESSLKYLRSLGNYEHRCRANEVCLYYADTYEYNTEYEIQSLRARVKSFLGKVPDALIYTDMGVVWVEVENSRRNTKSWIDLIRWFLHAFEACLSEKPELDPEQDLYLLRVEFYCVKSFENLFLHHLATEVGEAKAQNLIDRYVYFHPLSRSAET